ncbi:zinc finger CCCH domain-containing protein 3 isoform X1 [Sesamum indicum]|uniref:Zinc finger CCCH domain-containing protein 3 isoform X1 n=2 Tax=Sesamum indicum TaxID=4182 RepID=A0A6I9UGA0_SESIN|nr:zinc finger CCCH domain-containing protein 3 isoform X1 [Sesamum indicum]
MPGNRKLQRNAGLSSSSSSAADKVEEVKGRLKMEGSDDNGGVGDDRGLFPDRPGEPDCLYYLRTGTCGYGSNCRFNHPSNAGGQVHGVKNTSELPERAGKPDCGFYLKTGTCKYGSTCKYHHPKDRQGDNRPKDSKPDSLILLNILGLPMRQDGKACPYYMQTGLCKYGYACKFHHPQPTSAANVLPVVGPVYGSGASAVAPSSGAPSVGEIPAPTLPKATYFSSSLLHVPQSYMPIILSPSQGWNTYTGSVSPLSVTSVLTAPASDGQLPVPYLPQRPDQPECQYYMNHGSCKYGSNCKFHHPIKKITQLPPSSLGPLGLPLRPGLPVCSYYSLYGLCKYGPTCKFDHPLDGYAYAYSLSVPPLSAPYSPSSPYQSTSSLAPSSETSPSKPSKLNDWIKKGVPASNKSRHSNTKSGRDSPDVSDSQPRSSKTSSEIMQNESD